MQLNTVMPSGWQDPAYDALSEEVRTTKDFAELLRKMDAYLESQRKTPLQKRKEEQEALEKKLRDKKLMDLRVRISQLQQRLAAGHGCVQPELEALKSQLLAMLMFG